MTASVSRDITVTYAGITLGGTSDYILDGPFTLEVSYQLLEFSCQVILSSDTSEAAFLTLENALLAAFRTPRGTLAITLSSTGRTVGTGFDAEPQISKIGSRVDTGQSARYIINVTARLKADLSGQSGRFDSRTELTIPANSQRQLSLSGQYTSLGSNTALEQYTAAIDTFSSARLTLCGLTNVEIVQDSYTVHDSNNVVDFVRVYKEIVSYQTLSVLNDPGLKDATLNITRAEMDTGNSSLTAVRPIEFNAEYHAFVDRSVSTNLSSYWDTKIKALLIQEIRNKSGGGVIVLTSVSPRFHVATNEISASLSGVLYGSNLLELSIETEDTIQLGINLLPVWDGNPYSRDQVPGIGEWVRVITMIKVTLENNPSLPGYNNPDDTPHMDKFVEVTRFKKRKRTYVGLRTAGGVASLLMEEVVRVYVRADKPVGPAPAAIGSRLRTPTRAPGDLLPQIESTRDAESRAPVIPSSPQILDGESPQPFLP